MRAVEVKSRTGVGKRAVTDSLTATDFESESESAPPDASTTLPPIFAFGTRELDTIEPDSFEADSTDSNVTQPVPIPMLSKRYEARAELTNPGVRLEDVAAITHDLRSPLSTIALEISVIQQTLPERSSGDVRRSLSRIERNIAFIDHMVQDLLDLASLDARRFELRREPLDLAIMLVELVERVVATRDRPYLCLDIPAPLVVVADGPRLERVACNLIQNAFKYAPIGSPVTVRLEELDQHARISVVDVGPGLTADEAGYVFDKFRRTRDAAMFEGSGLGLYVSRKIVEAHGGRIGVDSAVGKGSSFYFELPISHA